jgi:hypothetical protein
MSGRELSKPQRCITHWTPCQTDFRHQNGTQTRHHCTNSRTEKIIYIETSQFYSSPTIVRRIRSRGMNTIGLFPSQAKHNTALPRLLHIEQSQVTHSWFRQNLDTYRSHMTWIYWRRTKYESLLLVGQFLFDHMTRVSIPKMSNQFRLNLVLNFISVRIDLIQTIIYMKLGLKSISFFKVCFTSN